jgi:hypothetical protein
MSLQSYNSKEMDSAITMNRVLKWMLPTTASDETTVPIGTRHFAALQENQLDCAES